MINDSWDVEVKQGGDFKEFEVPPDGAIPARVCAMIDVGSHEAHDMKGNSYQRKTVILGFELGEFDSKGKPFFMVKHYTLSLGTNSNLYAVVKSLHGEPRLGESLHPDWIANKPCLLQISHQVKTKKGRERTYANIDSVGKPPKGTITPPGSCVVWRVTGATPLPDFSHLPPLWHEGTGLVLTIAEWVAHSDEVKSRTRGPSDAADIRMPSGTNPTNSRKPAAPIAQSDVEDIPF